MLNKNDIENINKALELAITNAMFEETKDEYKKTYNNFNNHIKEINVNR